MIGDVIFFRKDSSIISRIIAFLTKSEFSHVGLIVGYDKTTGLVTVIESNRLVNTRMNIIQLDANLHVIYTVQDKTSEQMERILKFANDSIGVKYDYLQIIGMFISIIFGKDRYFNSINKYICSELIDLSYYKAGIKRLTELNIGEVYPQELLEVYDFKVRKEV